MNNEKVTYQWQPEQGLECESQVLCQDERLSIDQKASSRLAVVLQNTGQRLMRWYSGGVSSVVPNVTIDTD